MACSYDNTNWPGEVNGSDGAWPPTDGNEDEWAKQLDFVGSLVATNDATGHVQAPFVWRPLGRYVAPVIDNNMDVMIRDKGGTAAANTSRIIMVPRRGLIQDGA